MRFLMTPAQKRIMNDFWGRHELFVPSDLVEREVCRTRFRARVSLFFMARNHQVIRRGRKNGEPLYCGTTWDKEEFEGLRMEKISYRSSLCASEHLIPGGLNVFEEEKYDETLNKMIAMIEEAKAKLTEKIENEQRENENSENDEEEKK